MIAPEILRKAVQTEGGCYDTGLRLRGFEVGACPPGRYRYGTHLFLRHPDRFPLEVYRNDGTPYWVIGFARPDGVRKAVASSGWKTREEAERRLEQLRDKTHELCFQLNVGYKADGRWSKPGIGQPWGQTEGDFHTPAFEPMAFELTPAEALACLEFKAEVQQEWERLSEGYRRDEAARTAAIADAASLDGLPAAAIRGLFGPTECLECGATFDQPGHVDAGGMGCERCN